MAAVVYNSHPELKARDFESIFLFRQIILLISIFLLISCDTGASTASGGGLGIVFPSSPAVAPRPGAGVSVELSASPLLTHSASKTKLSPPQATAGSQPISVGGAAGALFRSPHTAQLPLSTAVVSDAHSTSISQQSSITYCQ